jgi:hypothetical protein
VVCGNCVDPVAQLGADPDQADPVPQHGAELADLGRGEPRLREQVRPQQLRQDRGVDLVFSRAEAIALHRSGCTRCASVILQQVGQPAPAERGLERHRRPRGQLADQPQERLGAVHHVLVQLHLSVLGDHRHLGALAVHVDADVDLTLPGLLSRACTFTRSVRLPG